jgi:RNA polymerase sigma factor (sigma-70 family)
MEEKKKYEKLKRDAMRSRVIAAYEAHRDKLPGNDLYSTVFDFVTLKLRHLEYDFADVSHHETLNDWVQETTIKVFDNLGKFKGTGANFYSWLHKICFNDAADIAKKLLKERENRVPLMVVDEDGDETDNPEIYRVIDADERPIHIPPEITGLDRHIVGLIYSGKSYGQIADELEKTKKAVQRRMERLKDKMKKVREQQKAYYLSLYDAPQKPAPMRAKPLASGDGFVKVVA